MLTQDDVGTLVTGNINALLLELDEDDVPTVEAGSTFADLGMDSLVLARLIIELDDALGVEPFQTEEVSAADLRTVGDVVRVYEDAVRRLSSRSAT
jgi:acyl carrier protein